MRRTVEMDLEFLPYLQEAPVTTEALHNRAVSNDTSTINFWRDIWINNTRKNHEKYGPFSDSHVGMEWGKYKNQPAIVLGSGPSLKNSIEALKKNTDIPVISCLHNFHYLMDNEIKVDLWVSLDAGEITLEEISEGGNKTLDEYLEMTCDQKLAAFVGSHPKLIDSWGGDVLWFSAGIPDEKIRKEMQEIEKFEIYVSNGGNVLGAAMYIAKGFWGCNPIGFGGADFCFDYAKKFHPWDSKYDGKIGKAVILNDIFGNKVYSWQSYVNFKSWAEAITMRCPGIFINCSENGAFGAYPQGLIPSLKQSTMWDFIRMFTICEELAHMCKNPGNATEPGYKVPKVLF